MKNDYGIWTKMSRDVNCRVFNDCSGRTISARTTTGFMKAIGSPNNTNQMAVHGAMLVCAALLIKKEKKTTKLLVILLFLAYQNG